jgi:PASTA domain-containing protein
MRRTSIPIGLAIAAVSAAAMLISVPAADAANSATFRDCSLIAPGIDPDFVQLSGVTAGSGGSLTASTQDPVKVEASESADPGDSSGHVTLNVTVTAPGNAPRMVSGMGTGAVTLTVPLIGSSTQATSDTISWAATFDNGGHACPSSSTPLNTSPMPFVVNVPAGTAGAMSGGGSCDVPKLKGRSVKAARKAIRAAGCVPGKVKGHGRVVRQSPKAGKQLPAGSAVSIKLG